MDEEDDLVITSSHIIVPSQEMEEGEVPPSPPSPSSAHPYLETVRGAVRATLPAYSCEDCREFHRLMDRSKEGTEEGRGRYQPQTFEMACNHRIRQSVETMDRSYHGQCKKSLCVDADSARV